jgi:hypothetical protein
MADNVDVTKRLPRGAIPSPQSDIAAAKPHILDPNKALPSQFLMWPPASHVSYWGNGYGQYGDCVSAEEAFAKVIAAPQKFLEDNTVINWASLNGYLNGATLTGVMQTMQRSGFQVNPKIYNDGLYYSVDWTNAATLQSAIYLLGPVKIGCASNGFETNPFGQVSPGRHGWAMYNYPKNQPEDHCVSLCGYGTLSELRTLFSQQGVPVFPPPGMPNGTCYAVFTWDSIGIIDEQSMLNMTYEAWARNPATVVATPNIYLTTQGNDGIWTFDTTMPQIQPIQLNSGHGFTGVAAVGNTLYLTTQGSDGIWTFDLASWDKPVQISGGHGFTGIVAMGNTLYLTTHGNDGIWAFDITQSKLTQLNSGHGFSWVTAVGNSLYLSTQGNDGIWTFDTTTPQIGPIQLNSGHGFTGVTTVGSILYLTTHGNDGIWTFDTTTPQIGPIQLNSGHGFTGVTAVGNTLYLTTHGNDGIWTFDITTPHIGPIQLNGGHGFVGILYVP